MKRCLGLLPSQPSPQTKGLTQHTQPHSTHSTTLPTRPSPQTQATNSTLLNSFSLFSLFSILLCSLNSGIITQVGMTYPYPPLKTRADSFSDAIYSTLGSFSDNEEDDNGFNEGNEDEGDEGDDTAGDGARDRDMGDPDAAGGPVRATSSVKPGIHKRPSNLSIPNGNVNGQTGHTAVNRSPQPTSPGSRLHNQQLVVLSLDLSSYRHQTQYLIIASCLMFFSLIYGALQEELVVHIFAGHLPFFLSFVTFAGYGGWAGVVVTLGVKGEDGRGRVGMKLNKLKVRAWRSGRARRREEEKERKQRRSCEVAKWPAS